MDVISGAHRRKVARLAVFGSTVRNKATGGSDIDILMVFEGPANSERYFGLQFFLEDHLGIMVDLVTEKSLRKELRSFCWFPRSSAHRYT